MAARLPEVGPVTAALVLALCSVIPVAWSLLVEPSASVLANEGYVTEPIDWRPLSPFEAFALATVVIVPVALVVGWLGGLVWRRHAMVGVLVTITLAWALGIVLLPIAANLLGLPLRTGIFCMFGCEANLRDDQPLSGVIAYAQLVFTVVLIAYALLIPAFVFWLGGKIGWYIVPVLAVIGGHAVVHWLAILSPTAGAQVPYACLAIGVVLWALWMQRSSRAARAALVAPPDDGATVPDIT
jgi:hypothetical protein